MNESFPVLKIQNLSFEYEYGVPILEDINLQLFQGQIVGLVGPNGIGKTTLVQLIAGHLQPRKGTINIHTDNDMLNYNKIALVDQHLSLYENLSVAHNICIQKITKLNFALISNEKVANMARPTLERLNIDIPLSVKVSDLSFAHKQLVEICRAIYRNPDILILDEPTSALDLKSKYQLFDVLKNFVSDGTLVILVTHDWNDLEGLADITFTIENGKIFSKDIEFISNENYSKQFVRNHFISKGDLEFRVKINHTEREVGLKVNKGMVQIYHFDDAWERGVVSSSLTGIKNNNVSISFWGKRISPQPDNLKKNGIRFLLADRKKYGLFSNLPVLNICSLLGGIDLPIFGRSDAIQKITNYLNEFMIRFQSISAPSKILSGGNQQKLLWACLRMAKPAFIIIEEPLLGLDIDGQKKIKEEIQFLSESGIGILVMTCYSNMYLEWDILHPIYYECSQ